MVVVVQDLQGNAIGSSKTVIDSLAQGETKQIFFTWPEAFESDAGFVEVYPRVDTTLEAK